MTLDEILFQIEPKVCDKGINFHCLKGISYLMHIYMLISQLAYYKVAIFIFTENKINLTLSSCMFILGKWFFFMYHIMFFLFD